jgi:hypothetical protein
MTRKSLWGAAVVAAFVALSAGAGYALPDQRVDREVVQLAQAQGTEPRELEPRYQPVPPEEKSWYNGSYIFGLTRGVAGSTMVPAAKAPLFVLSVPLDLVLLPFAAIGGLFG